MKYTTLFFDLDDTLYKNEDGLWHEIKNRMSKYMIEKLGLSPDEVARLREYYYHTYGTTLRGLQHDYQIDADEYLRYVHNIPLEKYLKPNRKLKEMIRSLPQTKWVFTNADSEHANRVLQVLELDDLFDGIIDVKRMNFYCKPELQVYQTALSIAGDPKAQQCVMFDDSIKNLEPANELGFTTVLVGESQPKGNDIQYQIPDLLSLPKVMPELWQNL